MPPLEKAHTIPADGGPPVRMFQNHPIRWRIALGAIGFVLLAAAPLSAATFRVNGTADTDDGVCGPAAGECTLREAIAAAVAAAGRDTIRFDPTVFVADAEPVRIALASELPIIADPAGTVIDGTGASVRVVGDGSIANGLVFASAPGVGLGKVTVRNVSVQLFTGHGIHICGGVPPECGADVTGALVRNVVAANCDGTGIRVEGRVNKKPRVLDSVTYATGNDGIRLAGLQSLVGARVQGSTATRSGRSGIALRAVRQTGSSVTDSFGITCVESGVLVSDEGTTIKPTVANVVALGNREGVAMANGQLVAGTISNVVATDNEVGVELAAFEAGGPTITKVVADANVHHGIHVVGGNDVTIARARAVANGRSGIEARTSVGLTVSDVMTMGNLTGIELGSSSGVVTRVIAANNRGHGIDVPTPGGNLVFQNLTLANGIYSAGIWVEQGSGGNVVRENVSLGNTEDLYDDNDDCGTNVWSANIFTKAHPPCIR
jgi:CSLREA domain-containing protein